MDFKSGPHVYIGPSIPSINLHNGDVFSAAPGRKIRDYLEEYPDLSGLFIPYGQMSHSIAALTVPGSRLAILFRKFAGR